MEQVYTVLGMDCEHCQTAVQQVLKELPGVTDAVADCQTGKLMLVSDRVVPVELVRRALREAGYELG